MSKMKEKIAAKRASAGGVLVDSPIAVVPEPVEAVVEPVKEKKKIITEVPDKKITKKLIIQEEDDKLEGGSFGDE